MRTLATYDFLWNAKIVEDLRKNQFHSFKSCGSVGSWNEPEGLGKSFTDYHDYHSGIVLWFGEICDEIDCLVGLWVLGCREWHQFTYWRCAGYPSLGTGRAKGDEPVVSVHVLLPVFCLE